MKFYAFLTRTEKVQDQFKKKKSTRIVATKVCEGETRGEVIRKVFDKFHNDPRWKLILEKNIEIGTQEELTKRLGVLNFE